MSVSTVCKLCVSAASAEIVRAIESMYGDKRIAVQKEATEWPVTGDRGVFVNSYADPTILSVKKDSIDATEIYFNSFSRLEELAAWLSRDLSCRLVVNQYQSVATASYWAYYLNGELLRVLEAGDGEVFEQAGVRLGFEHDPPGHDIAEFGEEPCVVFDYEDIDAYNAAVGIPVEVYQELAPGWENLFVTTPGRPERPRWKFWS